MGTKANRDGINLEIAEVATDQVRDYCRRQRVTLEWLADVLGYYPPTLSNYLNDNRPLPASLVVRLTMRCGFALISELCRQCGGVFIPVSKRAQFGNGSAAYHAALKFVETSGAAAKSFFTALEDGKLTQAEYDTVTKWLSKHAEAITLLRQAFDEMPISKSEEADDEQAA